MGQSQTHKITGMGTTTVRKSLHVKHQKYIYLFHPALGLEKKSLHVSNKSRISHPQPKSPNKSSSDIVHVPACPFVCCPSDPGCSLRWFYRAVLGCEQHCVFRKWRNSSPPIADQLQAMDRYWSPFFRADHEVHPKYATARRTWGTK